MYPCHCGECRRARKLLLSLLDPKQVHDLNYDGYFNVTSSQGRPYRIRSDENFNVRALNSSGVEIMAFCCQPAKGNMPVPDHLLMQKLMIETDEEQFLRIANARPIAIIAPSRYDFATVYRYINRASTNAT